MWGPGPAVQQATGVTVVSEVHGVGPARLHASVENAASQKSSALRAAVTRFKAIGNNWDGDGAVQPRERNVDKLLLALDRLTPDLLDCTPMVASDGEVGVYWSRGDDHAELSVDVDGAVSLYLRDFSDDHGLLFELAESPYLTEDMLNNLRARIG
jgi:hypothetical protein